MGASSGMVEYEAVQSHVTSNVYVTFDVTMSHRMSMCRSNNSKAQDMIQRTTRGSRQKAIRMRTDGWTNFLKNGGKVG